MISTVMEGHRVHIILMDNGNSVNILLAEVMTKICIDTSMMTIVPTPLIGMEGSAAPVKGAVGLTITIGTAPHCESLQQTLMVIVATQFLTHILINFQIKTKNSKKTMKTPKNVFLIYLHCF
jgi:hypothetical protein